MSSDYYEIFGVAPDADVELIKQRYRVLVRENHPDVSSEDDAHARMQMILEAWSVLSQPAARARYDLSRREAAQRADDTTVSRSGTARSTPGARRPHSSGAPTRSRTNAYRPKVDVNPRTSNPRTKLLTMVFEAAQLYHQEGSAPDAIALCNRVLKADPKNSEAAALMGDIYAKQGRLDLALLMYKRAMQNQPNSMLYRQKWESLQQKVGETFKEPVQPMPSKPVQTPPAASKSPNTTTNKNTPASRAAGCGAGVFLCCSTMVAGLTWLLQFCI